MNLGQEECQSRRADEENRLVVVVAAAAAVETQLDHQQSTLTGLNGNNSITNTSNNNNNNNTDIDNNNRVSQKVSSHEPRPSHRRRHKLTPWCQMFATNDTSYANSTLGEQVKRADLVPMVKQTAHQDRPSGQAEIKLDLDQSETVLTSLNLEQVGAICRPETPSVSQSSDQDRARYRPQKYCAVCGDKAIACNFNAVTCESCKAFFRRNAFKEQRLKCLFKSDCTIDRVTRRFCSKCRLLKCFQIGMKREWILTDEQKQIKRVKIMQNKQFRMQIDTCERSGANGVVGAGAPTTGLNHVHMGHSNSLRARPGARCLASESARLVETCDASTSTSCDEMELLNLSGFHYCSLAYQCQYCSSRLSGAGQPIMVDSTTAAAMAYSQHQQAAVAAAHARVGLPGTTIVGATGHNQPATTMASLQGAFEQHQHQHQLAAEQHQHQLRAQRQHQHQSQGATSAATCYYELEVSVATNHQMQQDQPLPHHFHVAGGGGTVAGASIHQASQAASEPSQATAQASNQQQISSVTLDSQQIAMTQLGTKC